jgi:indolepyruvate ferredoxin oxidoreductase beta subunit
MSVTVGNAVYPDEESLLEALRRRATRVVVVDGLGLAERAGTTRAVNSVILGALSALLETPPEVWEEAVVRRVPPRYAEANRTAFRLGREAALGG